VETTSIIETSEGEEWGRFNFEESWSRKYQSHEEKEILKKNRCLLRSAKLLEYNHIYQLKPIQIGD